MTLSYTRAGSNWVAAIGPIRLHLDDRNGAIHPAQAAVADAMPVSLPALRATAADYLDLFVDRHRACGDDAAAWWLDEVEFRDHPASDPLVYALHFTLAGDEGGLWTVDMRVGTDGHRPIRFERRQG
nr:hypothetical protein NG677_23200 [Methylobacterium sp. OTU13CASTA1]